MSGKTVAGIILILSVINLLALLWFLLLDYSHDPIVYTFVWIINFIVLISSASAFSEKKK